MDNVSHSMNKCFCFKNLAATANIIIIIITTKSVLIRITLSYEHCMGTLHI